MFRNFTWMLMLCGVLVGSAHAATDILSKIGGMVDDGALLSTVTDDLGLDSQQAASGLGSVLSLAENKLPVDDYSALTRLLPGSEKYVAAAREAGVLTDPITDIGKLNAAMTKLGIEPDQAAGLYSKLGDFVGKAGGGSMQEKLMGILQ